jgi:hypothetical protein
MQSFMLLGIPLIMIFTSGPVNQPTIAVVALSQKMVGHT